MPATQLERIVSRFEVQPSGCWWHPSIPTAKGYAQTGYGWPVVRSTLIHRLSWMYYKGDIPEGMVLDHTCHNPSECVGGNNCIHRRCVNPNHLQLISAAENNSKTVRVLKYKTKCVNGHLLKDNLYTYSRGNACHTCKKEQSKMNNRKYRSAKKVGA